MDKLLAQETGLPVIVADDPLTCVTRGGGKVLDVHLLNTPKMSIN